MHFPKKIYILIVCLVRLNLLKLENGEIGSGDKSEDGLRRVRKKSEEISGRHEGSDKSGSGTKTKQTHCNRLRRAKQSVGVGEVPYRKES